MSEQPPPPPTKVGGEIDRFNDILHAQGDDLDEFNDPDVDFDQLFTNFDQNEEEPIPTNIPWLHADVVPQEEEEQARSTQKRPVLTPTTPTTPTATKIIKKIKTKSLTQRSEQEEEPMPKYLSSTNKLFEEHIMPLIPHDTIEDKTILIEEFRQLAHLEQRLQMAKLDIALWKVYLQSGTGKLNVGLGHGEDEEDKRSFLQQLQYPLATPPHIWPEKLKTAIMEDPNVSVDDKNHLNHNIYLNYTNQMLAQYRAEYLSYETQIENKRQHLGTNLSSEIEQKIKELVQDYGTILYSIVNDGFIAAVKFTYRDRIVEMEFEREDAMHEYTQEFQTLMKSKTTAARAQMEVELLKQRVAHQQLSPMFCSIQVPAPTDLETIQDDSLRQRLLYRYEQLLKRTKSELILIHIRTVEIKADELDKEFNNNLRLFFQKLRSSYTSSTVKRTLSDIMNRRCDLIDERLKTLLDLKVRFFVKAPTVNKF